MNSQGKVDSYGFPMRQVVTMLFLKFFYDVGCAGRS